jgi:hypothetical protein
LGIEGEKLNDGAEFQLARQFATAEWSGTFAESSLDFAFRAPSDIGRGHLKRQFPDKRGPGSAQCRPLVLTLGPSRDHLDAIEVKISLGR